MAQELVYEHGLEDAKQFARILYIAHAITFFFSLGTLSILVLIVNYIRRPDTIGTMVYTHHTWMIRSFWFYLLWMVIAVLMVVFTLGLGIPVAWLVGVGAWLWMAYRIIRGFLDLNNNKAMPV